jgi:DUF1707 SHOCT-like domain
VQDHPHPDPFRIRVRAVMPAQRGDQRGRHYFREYALVNLGTRQDENTVAAVLVTAIIPRDFRLAECLIHRTVQAIPDGHLIPVRATAVPEPLNINRNVKGRPSDRSRAGSATSHSRIVPSLLPLAIVPVAAERDGIDDGRTAGQDRAQQAGVRAIGEIPQPEPAVEAAGGQMTAGEFDQRTGRALTARTWGELGELVADLPAARPAAPAPAATTSPGRPQPPSERAAPVLAGIVIAAVVLVHVIHGGWGLIWLLLPALLIARRVTCH